MQWLALWQVQKEREKQDADEMQRWGSETTFYKRWGSNLDSGGDF